MVAVQTAIASSDATLVSDLGSLLVAHTQILDPRWRIEAIVRRVPALVRFGVPLDATRAQIRELATHARCPMPLRSLLVEQLVASLEVGFVCALWAPSWRESAQLGVDAAVRAGGLQAMDRGIERIVAEVDRRRYAAPRVVHAKTLADVIALVDEGRSDDAERIARLLRPQDQVLAKAHLARLDLRAGRTPRRVRGGIASGAQLLLVREAIAMERLELARDLAARIDRMVFREYAHIELAQGLAERGRVVDALRLLHGVRSTQLAGLRDVMRDEIRLAVRRDRECLPAAWRTSWELPAWLRARDHLGTDHRDVRQSAAAFVRRALRFPYGDPGFATRSLSSEESRGFLAFLGRIGVDVDYALRRLRVSPSANEELRFRSRIDALIAERIGVRANQLALSTRELPESMRLGLAGLASSERNNASIERAWFDEGIALSPSAPRRRRVLIGVAHACIRSAKSHRSDELRARLRMLLHLGGSLAADAIATPLATRPLHADTFYHLLEALSALDPGRAAQIVVDRFTELEPSGVFRLGAMDLVVAAGGLSQAHARAYEDTYSAIEAALGDRAPAWFADFARRWFARTGARFDENALAWIATCDIQRDPSALLEELDTLHTALLGGEARALARRLSTDEHALSTLLLDSVRVDSSMPRWTIAQWRALLASAAEREPVVDASIVRRFAQLIGRTDQKTALARGDLGALGVVRSTNVRVDGAVYRLVLLDRSADILTFLRFADVPVRSCFRSDSKVYTDEEYPTRREILDVWRDPLAICYRIERSLGPTFAPCGFLFGSFANVDGDPAALFNSLHVRPNSDEVRVQLLRAVERSLSPLGLRYIALANQFSGEGHVPDDYVYADRELTRLRALAINGTPVRLVFDDVSYVVNERIVAVDLFWKTLERIP